MSTYLFPFPGLAARSNAFRIGIVNLARELETDPNYLLAVMQMESGIKPDSVNKKTKATGIIQFMPEVAKEHGTTVEALKQMTATQQLPYVRSYFKKYVGKMHSAGDVYMVVFNPRNFYKSNDYVLYKQGSVGYAQNSASLDVNKDGVITVADVRAKGDRAYQKYNKPGGYDVEVPEGEPTIPLPALPNLPTYSNVSSTRKTGLSVFPLAVFGTVGYWLYRLFRKG